MNRRLYFLLALVPLTSSCVLEHQTRVVVPEPSFHNPHVTIIGADALAPDLGAWFDGTCVWHESRCYVVDVAGSACADEDVPMDVVLVDDEVGALVCYPEAATVLRIERTGGDIVLGWADSGVQVTFGAQTVRRVLEGDLIIEGERVIVWGLGSDLTLLRGRLLVRGDEVQLRGLTIAGDATVSGRAVSLVALDVWGDIEVLGSDAIVAGSNVFGNVYVWGAGALVAHNNVQGVLDARFDSVCDGNRAFVDLDSDFRVESGERGAPHSCPAGSY